MSNPILFHQNSFKTPTAFESYLKKKKARPNFRDKTTMRYFRLDTNDKTFYFKDKKENPEIKVIHIGKDLKGFVDKVDPQDSNLCDWDYGFKVLTASKTYVLFAESKEIYFKWIRILNLFFHRIDISNNSSNLKSDVMITVPREVEHEIKLVRGKSNEPPKTATNDDRYFRKNNNNNLINYEDFMNENEKNIFDDLLKENSKTNTNVFEALSTNRCTDTTNPDISSYTKMKREKELKVDSSKNFQIKNELPEPKNKLILNKVTKKNLMATEAKKAFENYDFDSIPTGKMMTEYIIHNVRNLKPFKEEDLMPKFNWKPIKSAEPTTKINIEGLDNFMPTENDNEEIMFKNIKSTPNESLENNRESSKPSPISNNKINNMFENLNDSNFDDEININADILKMRNINSNTNVRNFSENQRMAPYGEVSNIKVNKNMEKIPPIPKVNMENNPIKYDKNTNNDIVNILNELNLQTEVKNPSKAKVDWQELNDDWDINKKEAGFRSVNNLLLKEGNENLVLLPRERPKSKEPISMFDDPELHIKKSSGPKKVAIENLHYNKLTDENTMYNNIDGRVSTKINITQEKHKNKKKTNDDYDPHDVTLDITRTIKINKGEEVNVKRKILNTEDSYKSFIMNLTVPDQLAKFGGTTDRYKLIKEKLLNAPHEDPVYTGKHKQENSELKLDSGKNNKFESGIMLGETHELVEPIAGTTIVNEIPIKLNVANLIMKALDRKSFMNDLKNQKDVSGNAIWEEAVHDEYHTKITKTFKLENTTHLLDDYHIPISEMKELDKKNENKSEENNTIQHNNEKNDKVLFAAEMINNINMNNSFNQNKKNHLNEESQISRRFSQLNIEEVWDNSILDDDS